ncbi:hypothetical protein GGX14DRAFT_480757 [Mycena pura]|uniref:F-box domain-containing protein n=1 Tax=Mycena pura TaxID=153505 RepID=A0AAD6UWN7_9AGAR|nr:hypothetical protein GGX14DRAFT_480757 [Mycena pura]
MLRYLDQDVLFDILLLCDIYTVITFTRVNSYYRRLALVDLPADEDFETYTTGDLIEEVKRVVVGPRAWAPDGKSCATIRRRTVVHLGKPKNTYGKVSLLPGGRYILASSWLEDGVWEVSTGRFVWGPQDACDRIHVDMLDGGDVAHFIHLCKHPL